MRIISGKTKGRKLFHDRSKGLRPTSAKVREALFNIIQNEIRDVRFLDLFAGTGAVGIEAASRGASEVTLVEQNKKRCQRIKDIITSFELRDNVKVVCEDVLTFLKRCDSGLYDIVFADPPYSYGRMYEAIELIYNNKILVSEGILLIEHASKRLMPDRVENLVCVRRYPYGDTMISRYERADD